MPVAEVSAKRVADAEAVLLRPALVDDRAVVAELRRHAVVALRPSRTRAARAGRRVDRVDGLLVAEREPAVLADRRSPSPGVGERLLDRRVGRRPAVRAGDHVARRRCGCSSAPRVVSFRPAATTVTSVTSATPIVSAVAVVIVRPGWRIALRRASPPAAPPTACAGRPEQRRQRRAPRAPGAARGRRPASAARSAATGATRVARHAGSRPATSVTSVPTQQRDDDRARGEHGARLGQREPHRVEQRVERLRQPEAGERGRRPTRARRSRAPRPARSRAPGGGPRRPSAAARAHACAGRR